MSLTVEYVVFGVLMAANVGLGSYFALRKARATTTDEMFLGSRTLKVLPLAVSVVASITSPTGIVAFTGHFYAYGFHLNWVNLAVVVVLPVTTHVIIPVLYNLRATSVFEYLRMRYGAKMGLTACGICFILMQSNGAVVIFAASITITTIFRVPFMWSCLSIGAVGTIYTALGGLRGVVWMDCLQAALTLLAPATIIFKVVYDAHHATTPLRPLSDFDVRSYFLDTRLDLTQDENVWSCFVGLAAMALYSSSLSPMIVQRYLAARTLKDAQRTACVGVLLSVMFSCVQTAMTLALIFWYRDCDPSLSGSIQRIDQLLPFYVKENLSNIPGFSALFLVAIVCSAASTISSSINSMAAICYVDIVSQHFTMSERKATRVTKALALVIGAIMTGYSVLIPFMGSASRIMMMVASATTGPFVGLFLLAFIFPFVNSKGAGTATILMVAFQLWHMFVRLSYDIQPPKMPVTLDNCPVNVSALVAPRNTTFASVSPGSYDVLGISKMSSYWSNLFSTIWTIILGLAISACTGAANDHEHRLYLTSDIFVRFWRRMKLIQRDAGSNESLFLVKLEKKYISSFEEEGMLDRAGEEKI